MAVFIHDSAVPTFQLQSYERTNGYLGEGKQKNIFLSVEQFKVKEWDDYPSIYVIDCKNPSIIARMILSKRKDASIIDVSSTTRCHKLTTDGKHCPLPPAEGCFDCSDHTRSEYSDHQRDPEKILKNKSHNYISEPDDDRFDGGSMKKFSGGDKIEPKRLSMEGEQALMMMGNSFPDRAMEFYGLPRFHNHFDEVPEGVNMGIKK